MRIQIHIIANTINHPFDEKKSHVTWDSKTSCFIKRKCLGVMHHTGNLCEYDWLLFIEFFTCWLYHCPWITNAPQYLSSVLFNISIHNHSKILSSFSNEALLTIMSGTINSPYIILVKSVSVIEHNAIISQNRSTVLSKYWQDNKLYHRWENIKIHNAGDSDEHIRIRESIKILINSNRAVDDCLSYPILSMQKTVIKELRIKKQMQSKTNCSKWCRIWHYKVLTPSCKYPCCVRSVPSCCCG